MFSHASMPATPRTVELKQRSLDSKLASAFPSILSTPRSASTSSTASSSSASSSSSQYSGSDSESDCPARCTPPKSTLPSTPKVPRHQRSAVAAVQDASELFRLDIPQEAVDFSLCLGSSPCSKTKGKSSAEAGPPAFFPGQRISFSPKLRVLQKSGLRLDPCVMSTKNGGVLDEVYEVPHPSEERLCGMMLGLTGVVEMLNPPSKSNPQSTVKSSRVIADYCTDLTSGMKVWHRDASMAEKNRSGRLTNRKRLPCGTYVLPLTMRLPNSEKLAPSFESPYYRVRYALSLALFTRTASTPFSATPSLLSVTSVPFIVLPSTLPTPAPSLPALCHSSSTTSSFVPSIFSSMAKLVKDDNPSMSDWEVQTSIPTSSFSPCEVVPVTLDIKIPISASPPCTNQQVFVRLTLLRRVFCRESSNSISAEDDWALGDSDESKELLWERYEKEDMELGQRWGVVTLPSSVTTEAQRHVQLKDIHLPLSGVSERNAGYSVSVDMPPSFGRPSLNHGESSWFSPVVEEAMAKTSNNSWNKYFHVSSRFYIAVEIGFFNGSASTTTSRPGQFVACSGPSPFVERKGMGRRFSAPAFPGKLRELLVPITVGSVSEPGQNWYQTQSAGTGRPINRDPDEWQGEERGATAEGEDGAQAAPEHQGHWMYAPPSFEEALEAPPSYQI